MNDRPDTADHALRTLGRAARSHVEATVSNAEIEQRLAHVTSDTSGDLALTAVAAPATPARRRTTLWAAAAAAAIVTGVAVAQLDPGGDGVTIEQPPATDPLSSNSVPSSTPPDPVVPTSSATPKSSGGVPDPLSGFDWQPSGIAYRCGEGVGCTTVMLSPEGVAVSYDPTTRTLTRHEAAELVVNVPDEAETVIAVGPDDVVYATAPTWSSSPDGTDLLMISLAPGDGGREVQRLGNAIKRDDVDSELFAEPYGLEWAGCCGVAERPEGDVPRITWGDRDDTDDRYPTPGPSMYPNDIEDIRIDPDDYTVTIDGTTWSLKDLPVRVVPRGMPSIAATFDGGFVAVYVDPATGSATAFRGWPDGSVEQRVLTGDPWADAVPEPTGRFLVANGDQFARVEVFEPRPAGWSGNVPSPDFDRYLAANDPTWETHPVAFADAVAGPVELHERRSIDAYAHVGGTQQIQLIVTTEGHADDAVFGTRMTIVLSPGTGDGPRSLDQMETTWSCQPGHGHPEYTPEPCTVGTTTADTTADTTDDLAALTDGFADASLIDGLAAESAGIRCPADPDTRCGLQIRFNPEGVAVSFDGATRVFTRHSGAPGDELTMTLANADSLIAAGPDDVVYVAEPSSTGSEESHDVAAYSFAPGDTGREVGRWVDIGSNLGHGNSWLPVSDGLVPFAWGSPEPLPRVPTELLWVPRVERGPDSIEVVDTFADVGMTAMASISVGETTWSLESLPSREYPISFADNVISATVDGGFIAVLHRWESSAVYRGWADGTVDQWIVPTADTEYVPLVPDPSGAVLVPVAGTWMRVWPFEQRPLGWDGALGLGPDRPVLDVDTPEATALLAPTDEGQRDDAVAFANAIAGPLSSPGERRSIDVVASTDGTDTVNVVVTTERHADDSVYATRLEVEFAPNAEPFRVSKVTWSQSCYPGRGHQDFQPVDCQ